MNPMTILALLILVLTIFLPAVPIAQEVPNNSPTLSVIQIFPKDHIWNTRVDTLPVDAKSDIYISELIEDTSPYTGLRHYFRTAIPYQVVDSTQHHQYITRFKYAAYSDNVAYPIPNNPLFEQGCADHHMEIIDVDEMVLYELNGVEQLSDGSWTAWSGAVWDLETYSFRKNNKTPMWSTDAAGLPVFPGLVRYEEVSAGYINHSLRMTLPEMQNTWVWPARASSPIPGVTDITHPPAGQRFRLKASYDISGYPPQAKVILQALKTYGMMAADNTGTDKTVNIVGSPDTQWNYTDLNTLWRVNLSNFEAVDATSLIIDPNSGQAQIQPGVTSTPSITVIAPDGGESWARMMGTGTPRLIKWSYTGNPGSTVKIELLKGGVLSKVLASGTSIGSTGSGSYSWTISADTKLGTNYMIRVTSTSNSVYTDRSDANFSIN